MCRDEAALPPSEACIVNNRSTVKSWTYRSLYDSAQHFPLSLQATTVEIMDPKWFDWKVNISVAQHLSCGCSHPRIPGEFIRPRSEFSVGLLGSLDDTFSWDGWGSCGGASMLIDGGASRVPLSNEFQDKSFPYVRNTFKGSVVVIR